MGVVAEDAEGRRRHAGLSPGSPLLRKARSRGRLSVVNAGGRGGLPLGGVCRRESDRESGVVRVVTLRDILGEACSSVARAAATNPNEEAATTLSNAVEAWRAFCSCVAEELFIGRSVTVPPLGSFCRHSRLPGEGCVTFRCCDRLLQEKGLRLEGACAQGAVVPSGLGPATRVKVERVAEALGWPKRRTDDVLKAMLERITMCIGNPAAEVSVEFPGLGVLASCDRRVTFETDPSALGARSASGSRRGSMGSRVAGGPVVTVGHVMFSTSSLMEQSGGVDVPRQKHAGSLPRLAPLTSQSGSEGLAVGSTGRTQHRLSKSASAPQLAGLQTGRSGGDTVQEVASVLTVDLRKTAPSALRATLSRRSAALQLALTAAEALSSSTPFVRSLPSQDQIFPPLFDQCSRTRAALARPEGASAQRADRASDVIGSNYSAAAAPLRVDFSVKDEGKSAIHCVRRFTEKTSKALDQRATDWVQACPRILDGSPMQAELEEASLDQQAFCRALCRYAHYAEEGVPEEAQAPFKQQWFDNAVLRLDLDNTLRWEAVGAEQRRRLLRDVKEEVLPDYLRAGRIAIVNYALRDSRCRERLDIPFVPAPLPAWGGVEFTMPGVGTFGGPPREWRPGLAAAKAGLRARCVQNSATLVKLMTFWSQTCAEESLIFIPDRHSEPMDTNAFLSAQATHMDAVTGRLTQAWQQVSKIVSEEPLLQGRICLASSAAVAPAAGAARASSSRGSTVAEPAADVANRPESIAAAMARANRRAGASVEPVTDAGADTRDKLEARFLEATASLLSVLLRSIVEQSLVAYGQLFLRFEQEPLSYAAVKALQDEDTWQEELIVNRLVVGHEGDRHVVRFRTDLSEVAAKLLQPYCDCARSLRDLPGPGSMVGEDLRCSPIRVVQADEWHIRDGLERIELVIKRNLANAARALELYEPFVFLLDEEARVEAFVNDRDKTREDYAAYVNHLRQTLESLRQCCPPRLRMQMLRVDAAEVNRRLVNCAQSCVTRLLQAAAAHNQDRSADLAKCFELLEQRVGRTPGTELQLVEVETALDEAAEQELPRLLGELENARAWLRFTWEFDHVLRVEDYAAIHAACQWRDCGAMLSRRKAELLHDRLRIESKLGERQRKLVEELTACTLRIDRFKDKGSVRLVDDYLEQITDIESYLEQAEEVATDIRQREELIGFEASDFEQLQCAREALVPFKSLWYLYRDQQKSHALWMRSPLVGPQSSLNPEEVKSEAASMRDTATDLKDRFTQDGHQRPERVAKKIASELDVFQDSWPLMKALSNPDLEERHWDEIQEAIGFQLDRDHTLTLQRLLDMEVDSCTPEIRHISEGATREHEVVADLGAQSEEWASSTMVFEESGSSGMVCASTSSLEAVQALLDKHLVRTQTLKKSPYVRAFRLRLDEWERFLSGAQNVVHVWLKAQAAWLDLEPVMLQEQEALGNRALFDEAAVLLRKCADNREQECCLLQLFRKEGLSRDLEQACARLRELEQSLSRGESSPD